MRKWIQKPPLGVQINWDNSIAKGLVGCWPMNESRGNKVFDLSGNRNTVTITNAIWKPCKFGSGLYFDGTGDYVAITPCPDSLKFNTGGNFTVVAWIFPTEDAQNVICGNDLNTASGGWGFLQMTTGSLQLYVANDAEVSSTNKLTLNAWNQVVIVWQGAARTCSFYFNGTFDKTSVAFSYALGYTANRPFTIGIDSRDYTGQDYLGNIDNLMIFNRALSASEIARLYYEPFIMFDKRNVWD